ncbi:MAG TPA: carbamoyl-phosphate synthase small subunit [Gammaproteobacteria bacterium]|nr:carbamoyl-phosphate synthase small subunit [Gammaproteobacteria bacterium]
MIVPAILALEDGTVFHGTSIGIDGQSVGEVVFNTAMTGYQEILTDPSYARQLVTLTYPHIGNTGTTVEDEECDTVFSSGLIIRRLPKRHSNWRSSSSLGEYLQHKQVVGIADIDTRKLTRLLREKGAQNGCVMAGELIDEAAAIAHAKDFSGLQGMDLAKQVTTSKVYKWESDKGGEWSLRGGFSTALDSKYHVVAYDFGVKRNILRMLASRGCEVTVVPAQTSAEDVIELKPDGVFLSNGPGDPEPCEYAIEAIREIIAQQIPVYGICLGHQLLSLASGARTMKMKFGHHGANHPVQDLASGQVMITSQNHGFAVDEESMPKNLEVTHRSLFDGTVQGIARSDAPAFSFQGHPEASPGPHDVADLFDKFIDLMQSGKKHTTNSSGGNG